MTRNASLSALLRLSLAGLLCLAGCADGNIDDPEISESVLSVETIQPSFVELSAGTTVDVTVKSTLRGTGTPAFSDVILDRVTIVYNPPMSAGATAVYDVTFVVPAGGTLTITGVNVLPPGATLGGSPTVATLIVEGDDLIERPASASGVFTIVN